MGAVGADETCRVSLDALDAFMKSVFLALGVPGADARVCADVLVMADRFGIDTHGINRLKPLYYDAIRGGTQNPVTEVKVIRQTPTTAVLDGQNGMGQVIARRAMEMAVAKAAETGMGMVVVRNSNHYGIAGYYARMAVDAGMIGVTGTNARPAVAPTFGCQNMLGTNPLCFGMPSDDPFPFVLDCATSIIQRGNVEVLARSGDPLPPGWVISDDGRSCTDAQAALDQLVAGRAALLPLGGAGEGAGGHKGYGFSTVVEILSSALQSGSFLLQLAGLDGGRPAPRRQGHFFMAVNVEAFTDLDEFKSNVGEILRGLRASRPAPGHDRIYTAGEKEYLCSIKRDKIGVPLNDSLLADIRRMSNELNLPELPLMT